MLNCASYFLFPGISNVPHLTIPGDVIFGGLFPIHRRSRTTENKCGPFDSQPGFQYMAAMLFALDKINNDPKVLPNITLGAIIYDTCRSQTIGADRAKDIIRYTLEDHSSHLAGVIGPFRSDVSVAVGNLLRVFEIPQVSYGSSSSELSNKDLYKYFFRTVPPDSFQAKAIVDILKRFGWVYIFLVNSHGLYGQKGKEEFHTQAKTAGICIAEAVELGAFPTDEDYDAVLRKFLLNDQPRTVNVIVAFTTQTDSALLLHAAKKAKAKNFTWIGSSAWSNRVDVTKGNEEVAKGSITLNHLQGKVDGFKMFLRKLGCKYNSKAQTNSWFQEFSQKVLVNNDYSKNGSFDFQSCVSNLPDSMELAPVRVVVNAIFAVAHALDNLQKHRCAPGVTGMCDAMRRFRRKDLLDYVRNVSFPDAAFNLTLKFNLNQEMDGHYSILNFQQENDDWKYCKVGWWKAISSGNENISGKLNINEDKISWGNAYQYPPVSYCSRSCDVTQITRPRPVNPKCCWECVDCLNHQIIVNNSCLSCKPGYAPHKNQSECIKLPLTYVTWMDTPALVLSAISTIGIIATLLTAMFFVKYKANRVIKASAKELSFILVGGILLCFLATFVYLAKPSSFVCGLRRFVGSVCFTTCYAPIFIKTNRIYRIFKHAKVSAGRPQLTSPTSQLLITLSLIMVQILLTTLWSISDHPCAQEIPLPNHVTILVCSKKLLSVVVNLSYNLFLMLLCTVFAFKTRNFPRNFNEAKYIGISMYLTCSVWVILIPTHWNTSDTSMQTYLFCTGFIMVGIITLSGLLVPKLFIIFFKSADRQLDEVLYPRKRSAARHSPEVLPPMQEANIVEQSVSQTL